MTHSKIYTKTGDKGQTSLWSGKRIAKNHERLDAYGTIDELNSCLGLLSAYLSKEDPYIKKIERIQQILFLIGSYLSCDDNDLGKKLPEFKEDFHIELEEQIDEMSTHLPELKNFILPGGSKASSYAHLARCICRRAERLSVSLEEEILYKKESIQYLNRLSDYLFVLSRLINHSKGISEKAWDAGSLKE